MSNIPITAGTGTASVASETVGGINFQQIEVYGGGGASVLNVNPDHSLNTSIIGIPTVQTANSSIIAIIQGSVATVGTAAANQSVSGAVQLAGASPASIMTVTRLDNQVIGSMQGMVGQVVIHGLTSSGGGSYVDVKVDPSGALVVSIPSVVTFQGGTQITSLVNIVPSSVIVGTSIFGQLPAGTAPLGSVAALQGTLPWTINSVYGNVSGSVVAFQGAGWSGSVFAVVSGLQGASVSGTVNALESGTWNVSVTGVIPNVTASALGKAEDTAANDGDTGVAVWGVRNDSLASVTSADKDYTPFTVGPSGEQVIANSPLTKWIQGTADFRGNAGASIVIITNGTSSVFQYITGVQVASLGTSSVLVTLAAGGSILGYTVAPGGGGSNIIYPNALKTPASFGFAASLSGQASVLISAQGFTSKS